MLIHLESVDSTNSYISREDLPAGAVVWADAQTAGRGRGDHSFASPMGGIYFSCLLKEQAEEEPYTKGYMDKGDALLLTPKAAIAVCIALEELLGLEPSIKWVNDIQIDGKKVCGILCEHIHDKYIAGIGINVSSSDLPDDLKTAAGGIADSMKDKVLDPRLKEKLVLRIAEILEEPMEKDLLTSEYSKRLGILNKKISFFFDGKERTGTAEGINEYCNLIIRSGNERLTISSGIIKEM